MEEAVRVDAMTAGYILAAIFAGITVGIVWMICACCSGKKKKMLPAQGQLESEVDSTVVTTEVKESEKSDIVSERSFPTVYAMELPRRTPKARRHSAAFSMARTAREPSKSERSSQRTDWKSITGGRSKSRTGSKSRSKSGSLKKGSKENVSVSVDPVNSNPSCTVSVSDDKTPRRSTSGKAPGVQLFSTTVVIVVVMVLLLPMVDADDDNTSSVSTVFSPTTTTAHSDRLSSVSQPESTTDHSLNQENTANYSLNFSTVSSPATTTVRGIRKAWAWFGICMAAIVLASSVAIHVSVRQCINYYRVRRALRERYSYSQVQGTATRERAHKAAVKGGGKGTT